MHGITSVRQMPEEKPGKGLILVWSQKLDVVVNAGAIMSAHCWPLSSARQHGNPSAIPVAHPFQKECVLTGKSSLTSWRYYASEKEQFISFSYGYLSRDLMWDTWKILQTFGFQWKKEAVMQADLQLWHYVDANQPSRSSLKAQLVKHQSFENLGSQARRKKE